MREAPFQRDVRHRRERRRRVVEQFVAHKLQPQRHYLWNAINHEPAAALGPDATSTLANPANFATGYEVRPGLRLGLNGYWLRQTAGMKANGQDVSGTCEAVLAIGPGAM
ncbi:phenol degradation protein [Burkholderia latens]|uniref:Phenol degradation protein n=1 Tax=Burkholderia latens TaxID=488446 RepID=A0A6P2NYJ1_9BURK|nr:phenol degradation protein [Burkholderia latens]